MIERNYTGLFAAEMNTLTDAEYLAYEAENADELKSIRAETASIWAEQETQVDAAANDFSYLRQPDNYEALQEALWDFDIKERPWGYGKTEAEITAEVDRRVQEMDAVLNVEKERTAALAGLTVAEWEAERHAAKWAVVEAAYAADNAEIKRISELKFARARAEAHAETRAAMKAEEALWDAMTPDERRAETAKRSHDWAVVAARAEFDTRDIWNATDEELATWAAEDEARLAEEVADHVALVAEAAEVGVPVEEYKAEKQAQTELDRQIERELRRREILRLADEREAAAAAPLVVHSRADMALLPSPVALWDGWLYSSSPAELSAPGGVGKTTLALGLAVASFHALPLLGSFTRKGRTLYIAGEGERVLDRRLRAWEIHLEVTEGSTDVDFIYGSPLNAATLRQVSDAVCAGDYQLVIADTFSALAQINSENDNREVSRFLRGFHRAVLDANPEATPLLIHHVTETTDARGRKSQKSRGASAFRDDHDTVLMLQGSADSFSMSTEQSKAGKQKDAPPRTLDGLALRKVGPHVVVVLQAESERAKHIDEIRRLVGLMVPGSGYTSTELQERWGLASNKGRYQTLRTEAIEAGLIAKGEGNKGRYVRVDPVVDSVRSSGHVATKQRPNNTTESEEEQNEAGEGS